MLDAPVALRPRSNRLLPLLLSLGGQHVYELSGPLLFHMQIHRSGFLWPGAHVDVSTPTAALLFAHFLIPVMFGVPQHRLTADDYTDCRKVYKNTSHFFRPSTPRRLEYRMAVRLGLGTAFAEPPLACEGHGSRFSRFPRHLLARVTAEAWVTPHASLLKMCGNQGRFVTCSALLRTSINHRPSEQCENVKNSRRSPGPPS